MAALTPPRPAVDEQLASALGSPRMSDLLPFSRSPTWLAARLSLQARLVEYRARFRSPSALWGALHGGAQGPPENEPMSPTPTEKFCLVRFYFFGG